MVQAAGPLLARLVDWLTGTNGIVHDIVSKISQSKINGGASARTYVYVVARKGHLLSQTPIHYLICASPFFHFVPRAQKHRTANECCWLQFVVCRNNKPLSNNGLRIGCIAVRVHRHSFSQLLLTTRLQRQKNHQRLSGRDTDRAALLLGCAEQSAEWVCNRANYYQITQQEAAPPTTHSRAICTQSSYTYN